MEFFKIPVSGRSARVNKQLEGIFNIGVRGRDAAYEFLFDTGRKAKYDDYQYEFRGGPCDTLRKKHYDKSLRLLWKAENRAPYLDFKDCTASEKQLNEMASQAMTVEEKAACKRLSMPVFKELLNNEYTEREKQAIVSVLSAIGHGEAYAWLVSAELLTQVESTGARAALTMQVMEEAKHFVVLRELLKAFDVPIPRLSIWEYILLEQVYKAEGLEKFFGMNVLVEGIALSLFGLMSTWPGLEILRAFHLDESRHTALPTNYLREFPLTWWQKKSPRRRMKRLNMVLPALALIPLLEEDLAVLGIDAFDFGGSVIRKVSVLADRAGFLLPVTTDQFLWLLDKIFNSYCRITRPNHAQRQFSEAETTIGKEELAVEYEVFFGDSMPSLN